MKQIIQAHTNSEGQLIPFHSIDKVCRACGYDLTEEELQMAQCADCQAELDIKQSVSIEVTSVFSSGTVTT